ncbi:MAG: TSUP family transporter [Myxococcales bacterium]
MHPTPLQLALLLAAALFAGMVDAIAGGGGLIIVPALLAMGLPPQLALGTNKGQGVFGTGAALIRFSRAGLVDAGRARATFPLGLLGAALGAGLVLLLPNGVLRPVVLVLLVVVAVALVLRPATPPVRAARPRGHDLAIAGAIAVVLGAYDGFFGPGAGTFLLFAFVFFFDLPLSRASADAKVVNFASSFAAMVLFASRGGVVWRIALPMALAQLAGGTLGAHLAVRGGDRRVRQIVLVVVAALVVKLGHDLFAR